MHYFRAEYAPLTKFTPSGLHMGTTKIEELLKIVRALTPKISLFPYIRNTKIFNKFHKNISSNRFICMNRSRVENMLRPTSNSDIRNRVTEEH